MAWRHLIRDLPAHLLIGMVRLYQHTVGALITRGGRVCRFHPSCSEYYVQAVRKYGPLAGSWRGALRILRCHPWHPGGYDPP